MPRYKLTVEYYGTPFHGWQSQLDGKGVQDAIEDAIEKFSGERVKVQAAGRTDSGVHATGQVFHLDLSKQWDSFRIAEAMNFHLKPLPIAITGHAPVPDHFEARFSALSRHYEFLILNRKARPTFMRNRVWHVPHALDADKMHEAAQLILGQHDFTTFRASMCQANSPIRTLDRLDVERRGEMIHVFASARSFLHNQVRSMVGSLVEVGRERWTPQDFRAALDAADRKACGPVSPPDGLYLIGVDYPDLDA
ncbi:tRNA pseudouridine(38-40) synthase [Maritalea myrionectae]|uniref:tRNA pseudouridine synthase A n=1 Tax=Maritalea myrionectae TaxID=454601 RepID=A0A2R4MHZ0_9HYPH|nr:tRNA pseudouridine(38-40) synthase TruA [Maritalea myrionectae]AVX05590.1 tRNA pseudouridine(38-40) synthase [Maritalea myrionectae]